jgi:hypothetical protein
VANGKPTRKDEVPLKECTKIEEARVIIARVYALDDFKANTPTRRVEQQEAKNPDIA